MASTDDPSDTSADHDGGDVGSVEGRTADSARSWRQRLRIPAMPLWLLGILEAFQVLLATALLVVLPVMAMSLAGGFEQIDPGFISGLAAQIWMVIHGVPVELIITLDDGALGEGVGIPQGGWFHLVPLGLTMIPLALAWRAGRRMAQGAYSDQLWHGLLPLVLSYAGAGAGLSVLAQDTAFEVHPAFAGLCSAALMALGSLAGCYAEARSWTRMIGVDLESRIEEFSQQLRWAGSYAWAILRAGAVACVVAVGLSALLLAGQIGVRWMDVVNVYQQLDPGFWGVLGLTLLHLGLLPNMILWTLAYSTGAGFSMGTGTTVAPYAVELGPLPAVPILGALPASAPESVLAVLLVPVLAGAAAGWWLMREGENHLDDWFALRIGMRPLSLGVSTLALGVFTGIAAAVLAVGPLWLSHISLGVGRMTDIGPDAGLAAAMLGGWVALGAIIGYLLAPAAHQVRRRGAADADDEEEFEEDREDAVASVSAGVEDEEELTASEPTRPKRRASPIRPVRNRARAVSAESPESVEAERAESAGSVEIAGRPERSVPADNAEGQGGEPQKGESREDVDEFTARMRARQEGGSGKSSPLRPLRRD